MKHRIVTGIIAATTAMVITVSGSAQPARAAVSWPQIIISVASHLLSNSGGGGLEQAKREIIAAVESSKQEILNHIDAIAAADVEACTEAAVTKIAQIDNMPGSLLGPFVNGAVDCAALSNAYLNAVQDPRAADNIGRVMGIIYSIAMVAFAKYGFPVTDLLNGLIRGYENLVVKLAPACRDDTIREYDSLGRLVTVEITHTCVAHNGDSASGTEIYYLGRPTRTIDRNLINKNATRNTSRWIAQESLPTLIPLRPVA
ncbi:hypothetical protein [Micromonospora craniellae]|uniref:Lipoprotein n=1 Tax=Micromonospora craniellae TaxID=2294034 RepID=A0A372FWL3_9ACTN|nr:hypothetical protein [Micromonospora craniellae]QOC92648.1 hypothetical protein ID554_02445 [Micromonospora craniellae]RFS45181.1 hypothetical protein D0Q02_18440 [Micromonospora craniellae]